MKDQTIPYKIYLNENEMPTAWYNLRADMAQKPAPLLNPGTHEPMKAEELEGVFCKELVQQGSGLVFHVRPKVVPGRGHLVLVQVDFVGDVLLFHCVFSFLSCGTEKKNPVP